MVKPVSYQFASHFKLILKQYSTSKKENEETKNVIFASAVRNLIYAMVCKRPESLMQFILSLLLSK